MPAGEGWDESLAEAEQLFEYLSQAALDSGTSNQRSISHSGMCSTSYASCYSGTPHHPVTQWK